MPKLTEKRKSLMCDAAFVAFMLLLAYAFAWKAPRGFCTVDESFYPTIPYRLWQGDSLLSQEWHASQLVGLLQYPYMLLFRHFSPSNDGVFLAFRYFYFATLLVGAAIVYVLLRRYDGAKRVGAFAAAAMYLSHTPYVSMSISYNNLCLIYLGLAGVLLVTASGRDWKYVAGGLCFAAAVLCSPYLVAIWAVYSLLLFIKCARLKKAGEREECKKILRAWAMFTLGCAILAAILAAFVLSRTPIDRVIRSIPGILADPEHSGTNVVDKLRVWLFYIVVYHFPMVGAIGGTGIMLIVWHFDKRREEHRWIYYAVSAVFMLYLLWFLNRLYLYNMRLLISMPFLTLIVYILGGRKEKRVFRFIYLPGWCYSLCVHFASNTEYECILFALHICNIAGAYIIANEAVSLWKNGKKTARASSALLALCVAGLITLNLKETLTTSFSMWDGRIVDEVNMLYAKVEQGPCKGLMFYEDEHYDHNVFYRQTRPARDAEGNTVVYYSFTPWMYVADEKESASFSGWMSFGSPDVLLERMELYWEINPEKVADVVYVDKSADGWEEALVALNPNNYPVTDLGNAYLIEK